MLDHQHRVALLLQITQGFDQPAVVARMQTDRGFVEHVADPHQARADAGRQADPLQLAARKRVGRPIERQIFDADFVQEFEPLARFRATSEARDNRPHFGGEEGQAGKERRSGTLDGQRLTMF